ncbi:agmatine deiminase family protein [Mangrovibacterium sp.]|uniref:agmatine deiminase family protein n=1 Tax=Mangrovibacterium sp. TaxID=1961364 RepID=UPI003563A29F
MKLIAGFAFFLLFYPVLSGQVQNPRHPAEWEEVSAVVMEFRYFKNPGVSWDEAFDPFVKTAQACIKEGIDFYILNPDTNWSRNPVPVCLDTVFSNRNISSLLIHIVPTDTLSASFPWARDHGMYLVYQNDVEQRFLLNFEDDHSGKFIADHLGIPAVTIDAPFSEPYYSDGGNFMTDGHGTFNIAASYTAKEIPTGLQTDFSYFHRHFDIRQTLNLPSSFVHVDYFMKLIDEATALIAYIPNNNYDVLIDEFYDDQYYIDQAVITVSQQLHTFNGQAIRFVPIQNAPTTYDEKTGIVLHTSKATYINSLILNKTVLVPQYRIEPFDKLAIAAYKKALPGYNIVGVDCRQYAHLSGAIHCLTHEIYAETPIYLKHQWYEGDISHAPNGYPVSVMAKSVVGIRQAVLHWRTNKDEPFATKVMKSMPSNHFQAIIPSCENGTTIEYYLQVENNMGKVVHKPVVAPAHFYSFAIKE